MSNIFNSAVGAKVGRVAIGVGLATAAAVGAAWATKRSKQPVQPLVSSDQQQQLPTLINWEKVRSTAHRMNSNADVTQEWRNHWNGYYTELVGRAVPIIEEYAKTKFPRQLDTVNVVSRLDWIDANIVSFQQLFEPIEKLNRDAIQKTNAVSQAVLGTVNQTLVSAEVGILLGYLGRRVLGQYDLSLLGKEPLSVGKIYFVEPNIKGVIDTLEVNGDEFRLWIALHETTHAFEFESHPWVRQHFNALLEKYFSYISDDLGKMRQNGGFGGLLQRIRQSDDKDSSWIEKVMNPQQKELFQELQAVMSIVEGYSNHMMNAIGSKLMPNYEQIKERMDGRQKNRSFIDKLFVRLTGLNMKLEQYRLGEIFVDKVVEVKGIEFANLMWEEAKYLPTLDEVKNPQRWIDRVEEMQGV